MWLGTDESVTERPRQHVHCIEAMQNPFVVKELGVSETFHVNSDTGGSEKGSNMLKTGEEIV